MRTRGARAGSVLVATLVMAAAACGSSSKPASAPRLPADDQAAAQAAVPLLAPFGLQVQRSSVDDKPKPLAGKELSLYVQPTRTETSAVYASRFTPLTAAVIPALFAKYPGVDWIDLCQEPAKSSGAWETVPVTRLEISRAGSDHVDWQHVDLSHVLALDRTHPLEVSIAWAKGVGRTRLWRDAAARSLTIAG